MNITEIKVKSFLESKGFVVTKPRADSSNGVDLMAIKSGVGFTIEVKKVAVGNKCTRTDKVDKSGLSCDLIAMVTPKNNVILQPMREHLALCSPKGTRGITDLVKIVDLL